MVALQKLKQSNQQDNQESREQFLSQIDWSDSTLDNQSGQAIEELLIEKHDLIATHRFDNGTSNDFKVKFSSIDGSSPYSQNLLIPINPRSYITVELALLHKYGFITTFSFSKYASPTFAQRKPNNELRPFVDLRKINNLISDDYININHSVGTLTDAAEHMAVK